MQKHVTRFAILRSKKTPVWILHVKNDWGDVCDQTPATKLDAVQKMGDAMNWHETIAVPTDEYEARADLVSDEEDTGGAFWQRNGERLRLVSRRLTRSAVCKIEKERTPYGFIRRQQLLNTMKRQRHEQAWFGRGERI